MLFRSLFIVRAFALAATVDFDWNNDGIQDKKDLDGGVAVLQALQALKNGGMTGEQAINALTLTSVFGPAGATAAYKTALKAKLPTDGGAPNYRFDVNKDLTINYVDLTLTPTFGDDTIVLDQNGVASPQIGRGFSIAQAPDIRSGGGQDEVRYNVNAPVSVDGGTGFDKLVILGTEFADDIAITKDGIFGAGLNVRYTTIEVVEVDGLEGDDEFFIQSTEFGVAYRVIGGLGSDTINVAGDVTEDIITRELEGVSGAVDHLVTSGDFLYNGLLIDGLDYNVASNQEGLVVINEEAAGDTTQGHTIVREDTVGMTDFYTVRLAEPLVGTGVVYVNVSASRSNQEERDGYDLNDPPLVDGIGDTIWLSTVNPGGLVLDSDFQRSIFINGVPTQINNRAIVLTFTKDNWNLPQSVYVYAPDDPRSEGDRVVVIQHSVISNVAKYDAVDVRNVESTIIDNDTPGVRVTEIDPTTGLEDFRSLAIEGTSGGVNATELTDAFLVQLARAPEASDTIVVRLRLANGDDKAVEMFDGGSGRFNPVTRTIAFTADNWNTGVRVNIRAINDAVGEDPETAVIYFERDASTNDSNGVPGDYVFPNLRSGPEYLVVEVIDNETEGAVTLESGGRTLLIENDPTSTDSYKLRLTRPVETGKTVNVAILTDGLADVKEIKDSNGNAIPTSYQTIGDYRPTERFEGSIVFSNVGGFGKLTRGTSADLGNFKDEGWVPGDIIKIEHAGATYNGQFVVKAVTETGLTIDAVFGVGTPTEILDVVTLAVLSPVGIWRGQVTVEENVLDPFLTLKNNNVPVLVDRLFRTAAVGNVEGWLAEDFLEGQRIRVTNLANAAQFADFKIAILRGGNKTKDDRLQFTLENGGALPAWLTGTLNVEVNRIAKSTTFTSMLTDAKAWFRQQEILLQADPNYDVPSTREGVKVFPVNAHYLSKLRGPLAVEGGPTGADRSLTNGVKLPGEKDKFLIAIGAQPPESQQIDVLNVFNDTSKANTSGTLDQTTIKGFGMAEDLDFSQFATGNMDDTFGESLIYTGGTSYGKVNFGANGFGTDANLSTVEVVNLMLGEGNDDLGISGTLQPAPFVSAQNVFKFTAAPYQVPGGGSLGNGTIVRDDFDWKAQGFLVDQTLEIASQPGKLWKIVAIEDDFEYTDANGNPLTGPGYIDPATGQPWRDPNDNSILVVQNLSGHLLPALTGEQKIIATDKLVRLNNQAISVSGSATGGTITKIGTTWKSEGFLEGHLITLRDATGDVQYRLVEFTPDGLGMVLKGKPLTTGNTVKTVFVQGPHGGLTVVHGGGNRWIETSGPFTVAGNELTRGDGRSWVKERYEVGQRVQLAGEGFTRVINQIKNLAPANVPPNSFVGFGTGSVLVLSGPTIALAPADIHVAEAKKVVANGLMNITLQGETPAAPTSTLVRLAGSFLADGFKLGMQVWVSGKPGAWTISSLTATTMQLQGAAMTPTLTGSQNAPVNLTVFAYDPTLDGGKHVGGDHIVVTGGAGPTSPLIVYGDTSQDGVWYSGRPSDRLGLEFGDKPYDPFPKLPDEDNEDDEWVFPLADPYKLAGNDFIDAHTLFAGGTMPTIGFTAYGGAGNDLIIGSQTGDHLAGGSGDDTILGQRGVDHIYGDSGVNVNIFTRALTISTVNQSPLPTVDKNLPKTDSTFKPAPAKVSDKMKAGRDLIYGEGAGTILGGPESAYDDIIFGDHGEIVQNVSDPNEPEPLLQKLQTTTLSSVLVLRSKELQNGSDDVIFGNLGRDVIVAGTGHDMADGDEADDFVFGDNVTSLTRTGGDDGNLVDDTASKRFQTLAGAMLYSRTDQNATFAGAPVPNADTSGELLVDGVARMYRDPDGAPWWAEYVVDYADLHTVKFDRAMAGVGSFGNDYLAGSENHDLIFGQLGNDVIQGDGGIEGAFAATAHVGAARMPNGPTDPVGPLSVMPSFESPTTDGQDYVEGGGGNDVIFGGLGQDDLVGGSSDMFGLDNLAPNGTPVNLTAQPLLHQRPDGDDIIFGGAGTNIARSDIGDASIDLRFNITPTATGHADDADTIVGDNGNIIRIVGTNHTDVNPTANPALPLYVTFNYDNYGPVKLVVRGVSHLDYTPGGPDFRPDLFGASANGFYFVNGLPTRYDLGGRDEVHGEAGDDTAYLGAGHDIAFGDGQDDDIVGGWGNDWISGGTGQDGVIGDDGRIFTSRNTAGNAAQFAEPLFGINFLLATDPNTKFSNGNVINEFIYTPGQVQTSTINVAGALNKSVDITPFNLRPNAAGGDDPLFDANSVDDVIFGGLGDDFLHGASGDDAIAGGEALELSYLQLYGANAAVIGLVRTDFSRPWNPGDILHFGADTNAWHSNNHVASRLGEFLLYDEYDPRRTIMFNADGTVWKTGPAPEVNGYTMPYFLNQLSDEGPLVNGAVAFAPNGTPIAFADASNDGADVIFGDLGNDWMVGGTGKDTTYGGWGNDLSNADDVLTITGPGNFGDGHPRKIQPSQNDTPDTHPMYEDRVYGGAGLDVLIGNTGGDRLIDWVGEFNSYIVPFAPFGIATVSRQRAPALDEFLYALSRSQGADPTRWHDTTTDPAFLPRNGEPHGELGMVTQKDQGLWQDQTGGPTDPQPGNVPGGRRDVLRTADFNDGKKSSFAVDSGVFEVQSGSLNVAAASQGQDAVAVYYLDTYLPIYYEIAASIMVQKPTSGWKANAYVIFDYQSPTDFKFAGVDVGTNKLVLGHRTASSWVLDTWSSIPGGVRDGTYYQMLIAINGTSVTVTIANKAFSYNFPPRVIDGVTYGLNKGLVAIGSDNSRGVFDNVTVQVLPPALTLDSTEDFTDGVANLFTGQTTGTWAVNAGRYTGTAVAGATAASVMDLGVAGGLQPNSYLELEAVVRTSQVGGILFDRYAANDYKFVELDVPNQKVIVGHVEPRRGWVVEASYTKTLTASTDYTLRLTMRGGAVTVELNGAFVATWSYNGIAVDGAFGLLSRNGATSFDNVRVRTNDRAFGAGVPMFADTLAISTTTDVASVHESALPPVLAEAVRRWQSAGATLGELDGMRVAVADLPGRYLGQTHGTTIYLDSDAAGHGWYIDSTPADDSEFANAGDQGEKGRLDLLTVVMHEIGHVLGFTNGGTGVMSETLVAGTRLAPVSSVTAPASPPPQAPVVESFVVTLPAFGELYAVPAVVRDRTAESELDESLPIAEEIDEFNSTGTAPVLPWYLPIDQGTLTSAVPESSDPDREGKLPIAKEKAESDTDAAQSDEPVLFGVWVDEAPVAKKRATSHDPKMLLRLTLDQ